MKFIILILLVNLVCGDIVGKAALSALECFGIVAGYNQVFGNLIPFVYDEALVYSVCIPILTVFGYKPKANNDDSSSFKCILHNYYGDCLVYEPN